MGCSTPNHVKEEAERILKGECLNLFLNSSVGNGYQYVANFATGRAAFALAVDGNNQACGMATNMHWDTTDSILFSTPNLDRMEAIAINRCEKNKPANLQSSCRTFAKNNDIIWQKTIESGLK